MQQNNKKMYHYETPNFLSDGDGSQGECENRLHDGLCHGVQLHLRDAHDF